VLHRPAILTVPAVALRLALGELADEALLASARVEPALLTQRGHRFRYPTLRSALAHVLGRLSFDRSGGGERMTKG
jgi:NAD dependent epimerase/dehydratase family enzyme